MAVCRMDSEEVDGRWVGRQRREGCMRVPEDCWAQVVQAYNDGWADPVAWVQCHAWILQFDGRYSPSPAQVLQKHPPVSANTAMMGDASKRAAVGAFAQHGVADSLMPGNDVLCCEAAHHIMAGLRAQEQARRGQGSIVIT
ncbi:unnamed protein product [Clonostachys solani]|uniref:Uncharacterized protein n=1 Tax=Clonostachys solani TaxID=160281 RepID=A0A9N9Z3A2_9HYPO|nr:unnamed protein product [Clonostachys solani]